MSDAPGPPNPFGGFDLNEMLRFLQSEGPVQWELARQVAHWVALDGGTEAPPEADEARRLAEVAAAAEARVLAETGTPPATAHIATLGRAQWAEGALESLRPVLERLATTLVASQAEAPEGAGPLGPMMGAVGPLLCGIQCGFMVGQLAQGLLGQHDLMLPTQGTPRPAFVVPNVGAFGQDWSLPADDLRFYLALSEAVRSRVCALEWVQARLVRLACDYVGSFRVDPAALEAELGSIDLADPASFEQLLRRPGALLGAMQSESQLAVLDRLVHTTAVLESYADSVVERVGGALLPSLGLIREAIHRRRAERSDADRFLYQLLGIDPSRTAHTTAEAFCAGVVERAGSAGLDRLLSGEDLLPTPSELEAPGLWLARIDLPGAT
ncbi:MAG: zinc-dependent metalloprotease [Acidimicrobiia bacterium]